MSKMISPGELGIGDMVTIESWTPRTHDVETASKENPFASTISKVTHTDSSWCGDIFEVVAVELPFVVRKSEYDRFTKQFDTRRIRLMEISEQYVKAVLGIDKNTPIRKYSDK